MKKVIDDKMDVGMDVGTLLDRFLVDFGAMLGGKMGPSWHQNPKKWVPRRCQKIIKKYIKRERHDCPATRLAAGP